MQFPPELLNQIGVVLEIVVAVVVALTVAFWISLAVWTFRDIRSRTRDFFAWILAVLLVVGLGPIGLLLYMLLRPKDTLAEVYDRQLEEEALLRDITTRRACPECHAVTEPEWLICPHCQTELRRTCAQCGRALELNWTACPFCTTPVPAPGQLRVLGAGNGAQRPAPAPVAAATQPVLLAEPVMAGEEEALPPGTP